MPCVSHLWATVLDLAIDARISLPLREGEVHDTFIASPTLIARYSVDLGPDLGDPSIIACHGGFVKWQLTTMG